MMPGDLPRLVALVPMRHHSERVPGKNYRRLAGRPLYEYILETLHQVPEVSQIVVDTDSPVIMEGVATSFPGVTLIERPEHLRGDDVPMNDVLIYDVGVVDAPYYLQTHSTNPLLRAETISRAIATFFENAPQYDSLFSVTPIYTRLWDAAGRPINHNPGELIRTQDLPVVYFENSCLYLFEKQTLVSRRNRLGQRPHPFEIGPREGLDLDTEFEFSIAECFLGGNSA